MSSGTITIEAGANAAGHLASEFNSAIERDPFNPLPALVIQGPVNIGNFLDIQELGICQVNYSSITGKSNVNGAMYFVSANAIVDSMQQGANYFPGNSAGVLQYGGQYLP